MSDEDIEHTLVVSNLVLCGASGWVLFNSSLDDGPIMYGAYIYLLGHGILGVVRHSKQISSHKEEIKKMHDYSDIITTVMPLALFNTEFYLNNVETPFIAYAHASLSITPLIVEPIEQDTVDNKRIIDTIVLANICSLAYLAHKTNDCLASLLAAFCAFSHFGARLVTDHYDLYDSEVGLITLSIFCILSCKVRSSRIC